MPHSGFVALHQVNSNKKMCINAMLIKKSILAFLANADRFGS